MPEATAPGHDATPAVSAPGGSAPDTSVANTLVLEAAARPARLLGDIGGTNARFAWQQADGAALTDIAALPSADHASLADAMRAYLAGLGRVAPPWCAFGIANPVTGDRVHMTNHDWSFSVEALRQEFGFERLVVINDFTALALALPALAPEDLEQLGGEAPIAAAPIGLIGPGTGLGVSGLMPTGAPGGWIPLRGEGGHATLAAADDRQAAVIAVLRRRFGHASAERALSGHGLEALFAAVVELDGRSDEPELPADVISQRAIAATDKQCVEALDLFCAFLGNMAGNLALTLGARGGVYIGGGIVPRLGTAFMQSRFRAAFEAKGRFRDYLAAIPVFVIEARVSPALLGASRAL